MATKKKTKQPKARKTSASIVWFEVPADDLDRAQKFYKSMFGWN
ncbi:MAG: VOC family protein, partial [Nitrospira sp.]|nr:VOC family protein [Nitrospira sp.]